MNQKTNFDGPLFIIGMSRSGTKLIRDLLNLSPFISLSRGNTEFVARFAYDARVMEWKPTRKWKEKFYRFFLNSEFLAQNIRRGIAIDNAEIKAVILQKDYREMIKSLLLLFSTEETDPGRVIWGNKTTVNVHHLDILREAFPTAKFIHIIRDPRDRALSVRNALGGNMFFAADAWRKTVMKIEPNIDCCKHVSYESLIQSPEEVLRDLCEFLEIPFTRSLIELSKPVETRGDSKLVTRHTTQIVSDNMNKYIFEMTPRELDRVERLVFPAASVFGYQPYGKDVVFQPLSKLESYLYNIDDYINSYALHIRNWGLFRGQIMAAGRLASRLTRRH
jgi:hypothetical protein